jgi:hypothetical protein
MEFSENDAPAGPSEFFARREALERRVAAAAQDLVGRGLRPTVTRIRAALGGGSPNDLAPALKHWQDSFQPTAPAGRQPSNAPLPIPIQIADLVHELWQRAAIATAAELKLGSTAHQLASRGAEADTLREQLTHLRDQLERESLSYGELRAQSARHEAVARATLSRIEELETRNAKHLRDLGTARQRVAELEATVRRASGKGA